MKKLQKEYCRKGENPKLFHKFIRGKFGAINHAKEFRLNNWRGLCRINKELNYKFKSVFTAEDIMASTPVIWNEE